MLIQRCVKLSFQPIRVKTGSIWRKLLFGILDRQITWQFKLLYWVFTTTVWCFVSSLCDVSPLIWPVRWTPRPVRWTPMAVRSTPLIPLRSLKAYYSIYMSLNTLDLPPFDRVLNTLQCDVHCGHPMRRQPVISEFKVAISKKCPMNPGFTLTVMRHTIQTIKLIQKLYK